MARKVFISVLGAGLYSKCKYTKENEGFSSSETFFVQTATLEYLNVKSWNKSDVGLFLLTDFAKKSNWNKDITQRRDNRINQDIVYKGLEKDIEEQNLPIKINPLSILDGNNESEIWDNFARVFNELKDGDELYFDVTHAFRFLPMLILVLCNYAKFLKKVTVKSITYGNYEARNTKVTPNEAPIIDLLSLSHLQDWTYAAGQYIDSGNVKKLVELKDSVKSDELKAIIDYLGVVIKERQTCRGIDILNSTNLSHLKESLSKYLNNSDNNNYEELPLGQILIKVDDSLKNFNSSSDYMNGFYAAKWCVENGLYQQAITILQEGIITMFCLRHNLNIKDRNLRMLVSLALNIQSNHKQKKKDKWPIDLSDEQVSIIEILLEDELIKSEDKHNNDLVHVFKDISSLRNNFNHSGYNTENLSPDDIEPKIKDYVNRVIIFLTNSSLCS